MDTKEFDILIPNPFVKITKAKTIALGKFPIKVITRRAIATHKNSNVKVKGHYIPKEILIGEGLKLNRIHCNKCNTTLTSIFKEHRVYCNCTKNGCEIDGGLDKAIRNCSTSNYTELKEYY